MLTFQFSFIQLGKIQSLTTGFLAEMLEQLSASYIAVQMQNATTTLKRKFGNI
jgi:hypothetical protein